MTSLEALKGGERNFKILKAGEDEPKGLVTLHEFKEEVKYSFVQYMEEGMKMSLITCIDFTSSNLDSRNPDSLHFFTMESEN